jgi:hypothetical protein
VSLPGPDGGGLVLVFDASLPYEERQGWNRGCPPGYFAQFVGIGEPLATPISTTAAVRCRLIEGITAADVQKESGVTEREAGEIIAGALSDTAQTVKDASVNILGSLGPLVTLALLAVIGVSVARVIGR